MEIFLIILAAILLFFAILIIRALKFNPKGSPAQKKPEAELQEKRIIENFIDMIKCKTVSFTEEEKTDYAEFQKFEALLKDRYKNVHDAAEFKKIGKTGLLYKIKGKSSEKPTVLMAHYDVVPAEEGRWHYPAFDGIIDNDTIIGRGTIDTKSTLLSILEALELKLENGFIPKNDLYLSFSGQEEIMGEDCKKIVEHLKRDGIRPALVLDEGGAIVKNVFPGVKKEIAVVGIAEKGSAQIELSLPSAGGHASTPPVHTNVGLLSLAAARIEKHPFPGRLSKASAALFDTLGRNSSFLIKLVFANIKIFLPLLKFATKKLGGEFNALFRTTIALTQMQGSETFNVIPPRATIGLNARLIPGDTMESATERLKKIIKNDKIDIKALRGDNPSKTSNIDCPAFALIKETTEETYGDIIVSPYLMMAASDSRHYQEISDNVYRFSPMRLSKEERAMIHGNDERIPIKTLLDTTRFYINLLDKI